MINRFQIPGFYQHLNIEKFSSRSSPTRFVSFYAPSSLQFISFLPWELTFSSLFSPVSYFVFPLFLFCPFSLSPSTFPTVSPCLFSSVSHFIFPFPSLFSMRSTLSLLLSLSLSLASFYLSPTPHLPSLSLSFMHPTLFFIPSFSLSVNSSFLFSFSRPLTPSSYPSLSPCIPSISSISLCPLWSLLQACRSLLPSPSL